MLNSVRFEDHITIRHLWSKIWIFILVLSSPKTFKAWFGDEDPSRSYLLDIRNGKYSHEFLWDESFRRVRIRRFRFHQCQPLCNFTLLQLGELESAIKSSTLPDSTPQDALDFLQRWYLKIRKQTNPARASLVFLNVLLPATESLLQCYAVNLSSLFDDTKRVWRNMELPVAAPDGNLLLAARYRASPASYFGVFCRNIEVSLSLDYQIKRRPLNVSNARSGKGAESSVDFQFYELDSLIDAFIRGDLFAFINALQRPAKLDASNKFVEHPLFLELHDASDRLITSSLMLAASGWLTSGISQRMKGKPPSDLFIVFEAHVIQDVMETYLRCLRYASGQAEQEEVSARLTRCEAILKNAVAFVKERNAPSALELIALADKEVELIKPFTSILSPEPDVAWLQRWSSAVRLGFCGCAQT
jgi:hypothetical protein